MTNVGEVTGPRTSSPWPMPCTSVVFPAPRGPVTTSRSPARSSPASRRPSSRIRAAVGTPICASSVAVSCAASPILTSAGLPRLLMRCFPLAHVLPARLRGPARLTDSRFTLRLAHVFRARLRQRRAPGLPARDAAGEQSADRVVDDLGLLQLDDMARAGHPDQLGAADFRGQLVAPVRRDQPVAVPRGHGPPPPAAQPKRRTPRAVGPRTQQS